MQATQKDRKKSAFFAEHARRADDVTKKMQGEAVE